jgi:endonuclease/exonuclease/phosphatase family metal-dependent hydrolase
MKHFLSKINKTMFSSLNIVRQIQIIYFVSKINKSLIYSLFIIFISSFFSVLESQNLEVMSFNILYENAPPNNWNSERRNMVKDVILNEAPDLIGLQEVRQSQFSDLQSDLSANYEVIMPWNNTFFGNAIGYLKSRFTLVNSGQFAYSNTPDVINTAFGNDSRYASWAILTDNQTNRSIFIISTHFYSPSEDTDERYWSSQILMARIQELAYGLPIIAVGDFNMKEGQDAYNEIVGYHLNPLTDTYRSINPGSNPSIEGTVHSDVYGYPAPTNKSRIDYIFSSHMNILDSQIIHTHFNQKYPSDHFPIITSFNYGTVPTPDPNIINPGGIIGGKYFCFSFGTQTLSSASLASNGCSSSNIQYQWQSRGKDLCSETWEAWTNINGATNSSSSWSGDTRDVQFRRGAKRSDCGTWQYSNIITMDITTPITDPGEISGSVISCGTINPDETISISEASGGCGPLEYMWQSRDKDACDTTWPDWINYTTKNGLTFDPGNWNRDRQLRRAARRKGCSDWLYSNIVNIEIYDPNSSDPDCKCEGNIYAIDVRAKGTQGTEIIDLIVGSTIIDSWTLSTTYQDYTAYTDLGGPIKVELKNGEGSRDAQIDYIVVDSTNMWQAEDQAINTAAWSGSCGAGSYTEMMHCSGYIEFDTYKGDEYPITIRAKGKDGTENINLQVGETTIASWTLSTSYQDYSINTASRGTIRVDYDNDNGGVRDTQIEYIVVDNITYQAEDQEINTAAWSGSCGAGSYTEMMHCNGYIEFNAPEYPITIRAKGKDGTENINLKVGGTTIASWTLSTSYQDYTATTGLIGAIKVDYDNDNGTLRDAQVDYIVVDGTTWQAESQVTNTGVYQNNSCGGAFSEMIHCSGYIEFDSYQSAKSQNSKENSLNLDETKQDYDLTIFPNPTYDVVNIKVFELFEKETPISIYNISGNLVKRIFINDKINEINLSELESGIYFLRLNLNNTMVVKKIIKM